jgi:hypothetical protein
VIVSYVDRIVYDRLGNRAQSASDMPVCIAVRNHDEPLPLGHIFTEIVILGPNTRDYDKPLPVRSASACKIRVIHIKWYGRSISQLDGGHTALLAIQGNGIDDLRAALGKAQPQHIYAVNIRTKDA